MDVHVLTIQTFHFTPKVVVSDCFTSYQDAGYGMTIRGTVCTMTLLEECIYRWRNYFSYH